MFWLLNSQDFSSLPPKIKILFGFQVHDPPTLFYIEIRRKIRKIHIFQCILISLSKLEINGDDISMSLHISFLK